LAELLFRDDAYLRACAARVVAVHADAVELDRTVFYPMGGGQPGDTGRLGSYKVIDTRKGPSGDSVLHVLDSKEVNLQIGEPVEIETGTGATATCACTPRCTCWARWCARR
jgi:misacylated tRNA(Ala) deacylase